MSPVCMDTVMSEAPLETPILLHDNNNSAFHSVHLFSLTNTFVVKSLGYRIILYITCRNLIF